MATAAEPREVTLWPNGLPHGAVKLSVEQVNKLKNAPVDPERIGLVESPTLVVYQAAADKSNGCGMIVCPGGAYTRLAWVKEGVEVAQYLNSLGITVGVLKYRVPRRDPDNPVGEPLQDAQRAVRWMRGHASELNLDEKRIGILGFSAGGHLAVTTALHSQEATYTAKDEIDQQSCRVDFLCPIYAAYLGEKYNDTTEVAIGSQIKITKELPPVFLAVTADDAFRGVQAASLFIELKKANVPAELHVYQRGGHGYGIRPSGQPIDTWHHRLADWLRSNKFIN
jgi:acetyl esterase/lipase